MTMPGIGMLALARTAADVDQRGGARAPELEREAIPSLPQGAGRRQQRDIEVACADRLHDRPGTLSRGLAAAWSRPPHHERDHRNEGNDSRATPRRRGLPRTCSSRGSGSR